MIRSPGGAGFDGRSAPVASSRLTDTVAASLAIGALSLCLIVTLTVLSIKVTLAMLLPAELELFFPHHRQFLRDSAR